jgi:putative nucleotidyltransferase with HDIG domain
MPRVGSVSLTDWAYALARRTLAPVLPRRWVHVQAVAQRAQEAAAVVAADEVELLVAAAVLHDIGYAPALVDTGFHPLDGARYLRRLAAPPRLVNLVAQHSGAAHEARLYGLDSELAAFADEGPTPVRDALWWADQTTGPNGQRLTVHQRLADIARRHGPHSLATRALHTARPERLATVQRTEARLRATAPALLI